MGFIRVTDKDTQEKIDLNVEHITAFRGLGANAGSQVVIINGDNFTVSDSPRSLRGYIKKAQGSLPDADSEQ